MERRRPWNTPLWSALVSFGLGSALLAVDFPLAVRWSVLPAPEWARLAVLAGMCALLLWQERRPMLAYGLVQPLFALDLLMGLSLSGLLVLGNILYAAVLYGKHRASRAIVYGTVGFVLVTAVVAVFVAVNLRDSVLIFVGVASMPLVPVWWAANVRAQRDRAETERARAEQIARIAELDRAAAVHAERSAMARDLHDVIAGHVSAVAIQSEALLTSAVHPPAVETVLRSVRENSVAALAEMRAMIGLLRAENPDPLTAPARLRDLARIVGSARAAGLDVVADVAAEDLPAAVDLSAYRIVQEALTNAVKHAPGSRAVVTVRRDGPALAVSVANDLPAAVEVRPGTGLLTMSERASAVGGTLSAGPDGDRWLVSATLPLESA